MKESFLIYKNFYEPIKLLSDEQLGRLLRGIFEYQISEKEMTDQDLFMAFSFFKNQFILDAKKYEKVILRNQKNGLNGGRPPLDKKPKKPSGFFNNPKNPKNPKNPTEPDTVTVTDTVTDTDTVKEQKDAPMENFEGKPEITELPIFLEVKKFYELKDGTYHQTELRELFGFILQLQKSGKSEKFLQYFPAYVEFKNLSGERKHGFKNFIGGGWEEDNWPLRLSEFKKKQGTVLPAHVMPGTIGSILKK